MPRSWLIQCVATRLVLEEMVVSKAAVGRVPSGRGAISVTWMGALPVW